MKLSRVGVDLAKNVFQLHGVDRSGKTVWKGRLRRGQWLQTLLDKVEQVARSAWKPVPGHTTGRGSFRPAAT